ncbi:NADH-quinone oxidoreductase subunit J [Radicibacter daui]|uniref:NADH-quinone oxidoreductase subunit J n=1 Tax=Radicibacter daui TaxID=3064829 RepID=UPI004046F72A
MIIQALAFYLFAAVTVLSGAMVITARNPVHSVLFLVLAFFSAAGLFLLIGAEFVAMILVIVYVGAVAVLFLFVVMMLDIDFAELRTGLLRYAPIGALVGIVLLIELVVALVSWKGASEATANLAVPTPPASTTQNAVAIGELIYTHYAYLFQAAGLVLLVAMIGAIALTLRQRPGVRRQKIANQNAVQPADVAEVRKVASRGGI